MHGPAEIKTGGKPICFTKYLSEVPHHKCVDHWTIPICTAVWVHAIFIYILHTFRGTQQTWKKGAGKRSHGTCREIVRTRYNGTAGENEVSKKVVKSTGFQSMSTLPHIGRSKNHCALEILFFDGRSTALIFQRHGQTR